MAAMQTTYCCLIISENAWVSSIFFLDSNIPCRDLHMVVNGEKYVCIRIKHLHFLTVNCFLEFKIRKFFKIQESKVKN